MKISRKELDESLVKKIEQLDDVSSAYNPNASDGYVALGKNGFYLKRINDGALRKIYSEDEVNELIECINKPRRSVRSSLLEDLRADNKFNSAAKGFLYKKEFTEQYEFDGNIVFTKAFFSGNFVVYTDTGFCYILRDDFSKPFFKENVVELFKKNFTLATALHPNDITDIAVLDNGDMIIATEYCGIYKLKLNKDVELFANIPGTRKIELSANNLLFIAADSFCAFYNLESGKALEKYYNLVNAKQIPIKVLSDETRSHIFVVGAPIGIQSTDRILHAWVLDEAKIGYNLYDAAIPRNSRDNRYQTLISVTDNKDIYLVGLINSKVFVWKYERETLRLKEEILDCLGEIESLDGFFKFENGYGILVKDKFYLVRDNNIVENILLPEACNALKIFNGKLFTTVGNKLVVFSLTTFEDKKDELSYFIRNASYECNNIDILIKGVTKDNIITLYDGVTSAEITPTFYMMYGDCAIIKLSNCHSHLILLNVKVDEYTKLEGIVIKENALFLR